MAKDRTAHTAKIQAQSASCVCQSCVIRLSLTLSLSLPRSLFLSLSLFFLSLSGALTCPSAWPLQKGPSETQKRHQEEDRFIQLLEHKQVTLE